MPRPVPPEISSDESSEGLSDGESASDDADAPQWRALDLTKDLRCMQDPGDTRRGTKRPAREGENEGEPARSQLQSCREATGEGRRVISWIWTGVDTTGQEGGAMYEGMSSFHTTYSRC